MSRHAWCLSTMSSIWWCATWMAVLAGLLLTLPLTAQQDTTGRPSLADGRPRASPVSVSAAVGPVRVDGRLDDGAWANGDSIVDLRQREPTEGAHASERT